MTSIPEGNTVNIKRSGGIAAIALVGASPWLRAPRTKAAARDPERPGRHPRRRRPSSQASAAQETWIADFQAANPEVTSSTTRAARAPAATRSSRAAAPSRAPTVRSTTTRSPPASFALVRRRLGHRRASRLHLADRGDLQPRRHRLARPRRRHDRRHLRGHDHQLERRGDRRRRTPDVELPDLAITAVHRADDSGTTENFTDYLAAGRTRRCGPTRPTACGRSTAVRLRRRPPASSTPSPTAPAPSATPTRRAPVTSAPSRSRSATSTSRSRPRRQPRSSMRRRSSRAAPRRRPRDRARPHSDAAGVYPVVLVSYLIGCVEYDDAGRRRAGQGVLLVHRQRRGSGDRR